MYVDRFEVVIVDATAVAAEREKAGADRDGCVIYTSRTAEHVNSPVHRTIAVTSNGRL